VRLKKLTANGKQLRLKKLFDAGQVDFRVFSVGMVAMNQKRSGREQNESRQNGPQGNKNIRRVAFL
jgi:hypothetical protein